MRTITFDVLGRRADMIGYSATRVLLAVIESPNPLYADLMTRTGLSRATVAGHLRRLRRAGLVAWENGHQGTLRPLVAPVWPIDRSLGPVLANGGDR